MGVRIEQIDRRQRPVRVCAHRGENLLQPLDERRDGAEVEDIGVVLDAQPHFAFDVVARLTAGQRLHRQWVVVGLAEIEPGDGQAVDAQRRGRVDRIVLENQEGVEQSVLARDAVDVAEGHVLVLERVVVGVLQLTQQVRGRGCRCERGPYRHGVDQQTHHGIGPDDLRRTPRHGRTERDIMLPGQRTEQRCPGTLQHDVGGCVMGAGEAAECPADLFGESEGLNTSFPQPISAR